MEHKARSSFKYQTKHQLFKSTQYQYLISSFPTKDSVISGVPVVAPLVQAYLLERLGWQTNISLSGQLIWGTSHQNLCK